MKDDYEVIILAAGNSSRLLPITKNFPKYLLPINDKTLLEHQLDSFRKYGMNKFNIVLGYKSKKVLPFLENVNVIYNYDYNTTSSLYSLWLTRKNYNNSIIIVNSDLYFPEELVEKIISMPDKNLAVINTSAKWNRESTKVKIENKKIVRWGRNLSKEKFSGENLGFVKISKYNVGNFYNVVNKLIKKEMKSSGALLDYFLDRFSDVFMYFSITLAIFWSKGNTYIFLIGMFVIAANFFMTDITQKVNTLKKKENMPPTMGKFSYFHYGGSANTMIILLVSITNQLLIGIVVIGLLSFIYTFVKFIKSYLEMRKIKA